MRRLSLREPTSARNVSRSPQSSSMRRQSSSAPPNCSAHAVGASTAVTSAGPQDGVQLVPLDLVGDERRDQVVEVGARGEQDGHRAHPGVEPPAPAGGRLDRIPALERADAGAAEDVRLLPHRDHRRAPDPLREPAHRVQERAQVELARRGQRMQARVHRAVRRLEHPQQRLARRAQQRRVGAVVELDLVGHLGGRLAGQSMSRSAGDTKAGDGHEATLPHDRSGHPAPVRVPTDTLTVRKRANLSGAD